MPRILVTTDGPDARDQAVVLQERVIPSDLESDHFSAQFVERVGWALADADEIEHRPPAPEARPRPKDGEAGEDERISGHKGVHGSH